MDVITHCKSTSSLPLYNANITSNSTLIKNCWFCMLPCKTFIAICDECSMDLEYKRHTMKTTLKRRCNSHLF